MIIVSTGSYQRLDLFLKVLTEVFPKNHRIRDDEISTPKLRSYGAIVWEIIHIKLRNLQQLEIIIKRY